MANSTTVEAALKHVKTDSSIPMTPELFEKLYLTPEQKVKGELRKTFANPTGLALLGLVMSLFPFSCDIMGWRGAGGNARCVNRILLLHGRSSYDHGIDRRMDLREYVPLPGFWCIRYVEHIQRIP